MQHFPKSSVPARGKEGEKENAHKKGKGGEVGSREHSSTMKERGKKKKKKI